MTTTTMKREQIFNHILNGRGVKNTPPSKIIFFFEIVKDLFYVLIKNFNKKLCLLVELQPFCEMPLAWFFSKLFVHGQ